MTVPDPRPSRLSRFAPLLVAGAFFVAIAPTLPWLQFAGGSENLVVETVLEMRRGGPWFIPTLQGHPRLSKPPLTAWVTAAAVESKTVVHLASPDPAVRDQMFRQLAWEVRWPTLLSACVMLAFTALLGDLLLGRPAGILAALACGSSLMFLRFSRSATTDVQLALWVTATNYFLALALVRGRYVPGFLGAGAALGLALMSKGPVALVQTLVPFGAFFAWHHFAIGRGAAGERTDRTPAHVKIIAAVTGVALMLAIALPWFVVVRLRHPDIMSAWVMEVTREGATQLERDPWYFYLVFFVWMPPMLPFLIAGLWVGGVAIAGRDRRDGVGSAESSQPMGLVLALMLMLLPIVVMSFFKDKPERYLLPMAPAAAIVAAGAAAGWFRSPRRDPGGRVIEIAYWATLVVLAVGGPVLGALAPRFNIGPPWFSAARAAAICAATLGVVGAGFVAARAAGKRDRWDTAAVATFATGAAVMLLLQFPVMRGYSAFATSDLKPLADVVWAHYPDAVIYEYEPGTRTRTYLDLPIYAGRLTSKVKDFTLPRTAQPQVIVLFDRRSAEVVPPKPWEPLTSGGGRKDGWRAYVLPKQ